MFPKRAIIIVASGRERLGEARNASPLLPLVDRPIIQRTVESLVSVGIQEFDFVLGKDPDRFESILGDGSRWGSKFTYHLARNPVCPYGHLKAISSTLTGPVLAVHADRFIDLSRLTPPEVATFWTKTDGIDDWTGWGILPPSTLRRLRRDHTRADFESLLLVLRPVPRVIIPGVHDLGSPGDLLREQALQMERPDPDLPLFGREVESGVWHSRNVRIHPSVKLHAPVYVAENCRIGAGASIGPNVVIGKDSIIDTKTRIEQSLVCDRTYVGQELELDETIAEGGRLYNTRIGTAIDVTDPFILGSINGSTAVTGFGTFIHGVAAAYLLTTLLPVVAVIAAWKKIAKGEGFRRKTIATALRTQTELLSFTDRDTGTDSRFSDTILRFAPGLLNVTRGHLRLVGVHPRSLVERESLPQEWQEAIADTPCGLITPSFLDWGPDASPDETYVSESFYAARRSGRRDIKLLLQYLWGKRGSRDRV